MQTPAGAILTTVDSGSRLSISTSGTAANPRVYDGKGHTVAGITINANYVTVQNFVLNNCNRDAVAARGTGITVQNCDMSQVQDDGTGDINAVTWFGSKFTAIYNTIGVSGFLVKGAPNGSHTDAFQTWNNDPGENSSDVVIRFNKVVGPPVSDPRFIHQFVMFQGRLATDGGGGGTGDSTRVLIADNDVNIFCENQLIKLNGGVTEADITRNRFAGGAPRIVEISLGSTGRYWSDNVVTGTFGQVGTGVTSGPGPGAPAPVPAPPDPTPTPPPPAPVLPVPWTRNYPDGTGYPVIDGGGTRPASGLSSLSAAASNATYDYTGPTITSATSVSFSGKSNITIRGIKMGQGGMLRCTAGANIVLEVDAPYELTNGGEIIKWVGVYDRIRIHNSVFGPASPGTPPTAKNRFIQFGDATSVGAKFATVTNATFRNKNGPGNMVHAVGDTANSRGGVRYTLITTSLFVGCKPFDENDHEAALMGISTLQFTDGQQVIEFNRFEDCRSEPEVISMKMNNSVIRGNTFHNCVGSVSLRHGNNGAIHDNWIYGFEQEAGTGSYNRTSAGPRMYGAGHQIHHNTIQVNGNGGTRPSATALFESPLTIDSGDVAPGP